MQYNQKKAKSYVNNIFQENIFHFKWQNIIKSEPFNQLSKAQLQLSSFFLCILNAMMFFSQLLQPVWPTVPCSSFSCRLHQAGSYCSERLYPCVFSTLFLLSFLPHVFSYQVILVTTKAAAFLLLTGLYFPSIENLILLLTASHKIKLCKWHSPVCKPNE